MDYNANLAPEQFDGGGVPASGGEGRIPGGKRGLQGFS
jgi:hypothetical protein